MQHACRWCLKGMEVEAVGNAENEIEMAACVQERERDAH